MKRTPMEYRVVWKRAGMKQKTKRYASLSAAQRRVTLMGPEPWLAFAADPDELHCCSGHECGCEGATWREYLLGSRANGWKADDEGMPPLEYCRIEKRPTSNWEPME